MARIHLFMCAFLIPSVLSNLTTTVQPSSTVSSMVNAANPTPTSVQPNPSASTMVPVLITSQAAQNSSVTVTLSTSVSPAQTSSVNVTLSTSVSPVPPTTKIFKARMTVNETYVPGYSNSSSTEFNTFATNFSETVGKFLTKELFGVVRVAVTNLGEGSVVVDFDIMVQKSSNATVDSIVRALTGGELGYTILGNVTVNATDQPSTSSIPSPTATAKETKATEIWDKAIDLATPLGTFIIVVVAVALLLILLIALICVCCKYAKLKKKTRFPEHMAINNDSEWIRSSDDLLMWERNLRASEVKTTNGVSSRPVNERRT